MRDQCIHIINPSQEEHKQQRVGYTLGGGEIGLDDPQCLAKTDGKKYWLKFGSFGIEAGRLFNPHSPNFPQFSQQRMWAEYGKMQYEFRQVNESAFALYKSFLKDTSKEYLLRKAEREV